MSNILEQLKVNKNKIKREKLLSLSDPEFAEFLSLAEYSIEFSCIKNAVFPESDSDVNVIATDSGNTPSLNTFSFKSWQGLIAVLKRFQQVKNYVGWFFIDRDGPYFKMSLNAFLSHIPSISDYGTQNEHYHYGWVGEADNVGLIIEKKPISSSDKEFRISIWGI